MRIKLATRKLEKEFDNGERFAHVISTLNMNRAMSICEFDFTLPAIQSLPVLAHYTSTKLGFDYCVLAGLTLGNNEVEARQDWELAIVSVSKRNEYFEFMKLSEIQDFSDSLEEDGRIGIYRDETSEGETLGVVMDKSRSHKINESKCILKERIKKG